MSLIENMLEECVFLEATRVPDGASGSIDTWTEGMRFEAAITLNTTLEARTAERQGVTSVYTVTTLDGLILKYHDVFKRVSDGQIFRSTSNGADKQAPKSASFSFSQVTAERWELT